MARTVSAVTLGIALVACIHTQPSRPQVQVSSDDSTSAAAADPTGFNRRRMNGQGLYLSHAEIASRNATTTDQLLRAIPGVRIDRSGGNTGVKVVDRAEGCPSAQVLVDGVVMPMPFNVNQIPPRSIWAVELYKESSTLPAELWSRAGAVCGTLALWTK